jgi:hypothetical protein
MKWNFSLTHFYTTAAAAAALASVCCSINRKKGFSLLLSFDKNKKFTSPPLLLFCGWVFFMLPLPKIHQ